MKHEEILTALEEISDKHINEAEKAPRRKMKRFFQVAVAAEVEAFDADKLAHEEAKGNLERKIGELEEELAEEERKLPEIKAPEKKVTDTTSLISSNTASSAFDPVETIPRPNMNETTSAVSTLMTGGIANVKYAGNLLTTTFSASPTPRTEGNTVFEAIKARNQALCA